MVADEITKEYGEKLKELAKLVGDIYSRLESEDVKDDGRIRLFRDTEVLDMENDCNFTDTMTLEGDVLMVNYVENGTWYSLKIEREIQGDRR